MMSQESIEAILKTIVFTAASTLYLLMATGEKILVHINKTLDISLYLNATYMCL